MSAAIRIAGRRRRVRIGIIDDVDRPEARMLALAIGLSGAAEVEYLSDHHPPLRGRKFKLWRWTDVSAFGVRIELTGNHLGAEIVTESTAVYPDGEPRQWQGWDRDVIRLRPALVPIISATLSVAPSPPSAAETGGADAQR